MSSRFAKLVNAQAAREQEPSREPQAPELSESTADKQGFAAPQSNISTPVATGVATGVELDLGDGQREASRMSPNYLDATHTASEKSVYSIMYRETVSRGVRERHFGPKELCEKTGIRSDRTIRTALDGLITKLSIEIVSHSNGSPLGPRYRVFDPKEIVGRRKAAGIEIDPQSKKMTTGVATPVATGVATGVKITGVTGVDFAGVIYNKYINSFEASDGANGESAAGSSSSLTAGVDDEAYAQLLARLKQAVREVTGRDSIPAEGERWGELAELLVTELKIAAGRTGSVSSVPAFLTEHLRRRLWKKEQRQVEAEAVEGGGVGRPTKAEAAGCPDCFGTGMWYPEGFERGVARCLHERLVKAD